MVIAGEAPGIPGRDRTDHPVWTRSLRIGAVVAIRGFGSVTLTGDLGAQSCDKVVSVIEVPGMLSFLAHGDFDTQIKGVNELIPEYQAKHGATTADGTPINYVPVMAATYWGFRLMIGFGALAAFAAVVALWMTRKGTVPQSK